MSPAPHLRRRALGAALALASLGLPGRALAQPSPERRAPAREPYADAPGVTPIAEPLRATANARDHEVRASGFLRTRADLGYNWDLNRGPTPSTGAGIWPSPYTDGGQSRTQTNLDLRLRLDVEAEVGYGVTVRSRLHVLDNLRFGSTPDAEFVGAAINQRSPAQPVDVRQLYGQVVLPFGMLAAGRMGALIDWGTGFFVNSGNGLDDDWGDVGDRVLLAVPLAGLLWSAMYEISSSGPSTDALRPEIRPAFDLDPSDDVRTVAASITRWDAPPTRARRLAASRTTVNFGLLGSWRSQSYDLATGTSPSTRTAIQRDLNAFVTDAWVRADVGRFTFEAELAYLHFDIANASLDPAVSLRQAITGDQVGGVLRADYRSPRFFARVEFGFASGDDRPGFGARATTATPPRAGDLDGPQFDLTRTPPDATIDNFRFHPNYRIDLILWRRLIGTVTDAFYVRPMARYRLASMLTVEGAVIVSSAMSANSTPSGKSPLGIEADVFLTYEQEHGFVAQLGYGLLVPLEGLSNLNLARPIDPTPAHALHLVMAYRF